MYNKIKLTNRLVQWDVFFRTNISNAFSFLLLCLAGASDKTLDPKKIKNDYFLLLIQVKSIGKSIYIKIVKM